MSKQNRRSSFGRFIGSLMSVRNRRKLSGVVIFATLFLFLATGAAFGQTTVNGTVRGTIKDPDGRLVPNATVTLSSVERTDERKAKTTDDGAFSFNSVVPGRYTLKVEASGFKTAAQTGLSVAASENRVVGLTLEVGAPTEVVTVTTDPAPIQTETGERSD